MPDCHSIPFVPAKAGPRATKELDFPLARNERAENHEKEKLCLQNKSAKKQIGIDAFHAGQDNKPRRNGTLVPISSSILLRHAKCRRRGPASADAKDCFDRVWPIVPEQLKNIHPHDNQGQTGQAVEA